MVIGSMSWFICDALTPITQLAKLVGNVFPGVVTSREYLGHFPYAYVQARRHSCIERAGTVRFINEMRTQSVRIGNAHAGPLRTRRR
jgi:hypothetical protein